MSGNEIDEVTLSTKEYSRDLNLNFDHGDGARSQNHIPYCSSSCCWWSGKSEPLE